MKATTDDRYEKLKKGFPESAYSDDASRGFTLTTIDAYHVIERLNEVFGICGTGWELVVKEWVKVDGANDTAGEIVAISELRYDINTDKPKVVQCIGGKKIVKNNLTDAYKSAQTNAICKGASFIGIGIDVYKGEKDNGGKGARQEKPIRPRSRVQDEDRDKTSKPKKKSTTKTTTESPTSTPFTAVTAAQLKLIKNSILKSKYLFEYEQFYIEKQLKAKSLSKKGASLIIDTWINGEREKREKLLTENKAEYEAYHMKKFNEWGDKVGTAVVEEWNKWVIAKAEKEAKEKERP